MNEIIANNIFNLGVNNKEQKIFEGQYKLKNGMNYNSYVIKDEKNVILDTIDETVTEEWIKKVIEVLDGENPDYLVISHMEPDHAYNVEMLAKKYPNMKLIGNQFTFNILNNFFNMDFSQRKIIVTEGEILNIGKHKLQFFMAPMVHWPEVMMTYEQTEKILFSADAFGRFGILNNNEAWDEEARRYYFGIVGKYGIQVQAVLKKLANLQVQTICPLHGPVLKENLEYYINKYNIWSSYEPEEKGVCIACSSIYGNTLKAANKMKEILQEKGVKDVIVVDLTKCDWSEAISMAFKYSNLILASSSYNAGLFPPMEHFLKYLKDRNYQKRKIAIIENGSWAPSAGKCINLILQEMKNITIVEPIVTIKSRMNNDNIVKMEDIANEILKDN